jgi:peptide/nickel transport system substrate-binding protein
MKRKHAILALLLVLVMVFSLTACNKATQTEPSPSASASTEPSPSPSAAEEKTLVVGYANFQGKFSPFFSSAQTDTDVYTMTQVALLDFDREGKMLLNGIEGETIAYNGTDYTYNGIGSCKITQNDDGSVVYDLSIRDDIVFSDGEPMTADDIIFNMYVYADPAYDGNATFYALPIKGLEAYRAGMSSVWSLILADMAAGNDTSASTYYTAEDAANFEKAFTTAGVAFTQEIIDYCVANYINDYAEAMTGFSPDEVKANPVLQLPWAKHCGAMPTDSR